MAETFNLNTLLDNQSAILNKKYTAAENGQVAMEAREIERAEEAVGTIGFLGLTVGEKLKELGIGENVMKQVADTAVGLVTDIIDPLTDYLNKYEKVFDQEVYNAEIQHLGRRMFFDYQALSQQAAESEAGQNFVYTM